MGIAYRILTIIVAVCISVVAILGACNIVFRMPDLYVYEFTSQEISSKIDLNMQDDELGHFFSDFMRGKEKELELSSEYRDREQDVFGTIEQMNMENARKLLNHSLYILIGTLLAAVICYAIFLWKKMKYELRLAFKGGVGVFITMQVFLHITFNIDAVRAFYYNVIFPITFGADDALPTMLTERFARLCVFANSAVAFVILIILASVTWRMTKPRRMFW